MIGISHYLQGISTIPGGQTRRISAINSTSTGAPVSQHPPPGWISLTRLMSRFFTWAGRKLNLRPWVPWEREIYTWEYGVDPTFNDGIFSGWLFPTHLKIMLVKLDQETLRIGVKIKHFETTT